jgi:hypothetical protein
MYHVLGYTNFAESVSSGSYDPTDNTGVTTGTNGELNPSGTDKDLRDTTASAFAAGDVGKWVLVKDSSNPENSGWYRITAYIDADNVTLDFRSGATEYPTNATGLSWWMMAEDNNTPNTLTDEWQLRTPHTDGWEIKFVLQGDRYLYVSIALDTFAVGNKILAQRTVGQTSNVDANTIYYYAEGETDGSMLNIWHFTTSTSSGCDLLSVGKITPFDTSPAHSAAELWALGGSNNTPNSDNRFIERSVSNTIAQSYAVWRDDPVTEEDCFIAEWVYNGYDTGFTQNTSLEQNARVSKTDIKDGLTLVMDEDNLRDRYEMLGALDGLFGCRANLNKMQTLDDAGTKDKVHLRDGIVVEWPGFTPQYSPNAG